MVGYHKSDSMTSRQKLIAGVMSGVTTRFITQPLDIVKLRTQLPRKKKGIIKITLRILSEEGIRAFWHGHTLGQRFYMLSMEWFMLPELRLTLDLFFLRPYIRMVCGSLAGCCSAALVIPLEVIRVRQMMIKDQYKGVINGAKIVYKYGGIFAFYEGLTASLLQMGPQVGISFVVFSYCQPLVLHMLHDCSGQSTFECITGGFDTVQSNDDANNANSNRDSANEAPKDNKAPMGNKYTPKSLMIASTIAGSLAGFFSKSLTYPFDLAKRRLQIASHRDLDKKFIVPSTSRNLLKCKSLQDCIAKTYQKEGVKGLFRGWAVTIYKAQVTSIVAFTTYEMLCYFIREVNARQ